MIRDWTERNFDFTGYATGFDPADLGERTKLRAELGLTAMTSSSASSPSAAQVWASTCCGG